MRTIVTFLLLTAGLAGCTDGDEPRTDAPTSAECLEQGLILDTETQECVEPPFQIREFEDPAHHCVVTKQRDRVHAPDLVGNPWVLGQYWDFALVVDEQDLGTTRLVYYDDQDFSGDVPQHYMVGTPTREEALHHAIFSHNPMIGRVHRVLYSPHESGDHADMFHFPLCQGSTWTTVFYGETFTLTARNATLDLPGGATDKGFLIEGTSAEGGTLRLSYSPAAQWFTFIDLDGGDGKAVDLRLQAMGDGYRGDAFFLRAQKDAFVFLQAEEVVANAAPALAQQTFTREDGNDGPYDTVGLHIVFSMTGTGTASFTITDPAGNEVYAHTVSPQGGAPFVEDIIEVPYVAGDWTVALEGLAIDAAGAGLVAHVTAVSIYDRSSSV